MYTEIDELQDESLVSLDYPTRFYKLEGSVEWKTYVES